MRPAALSVRPAAEVDVGAIGAIDLIARNDERRQEFIQRSVAAGTLYVAEADGQVVGYGVLNYNFYDNGWIDMLYVAARYRRQGVGTVLMWHMESICKTPKLFTSTNQSNQPMQALLAGLGYALTGFIENLDESDPELVYLKRLTGR